MANRDAKLIERTLKDFSLGALNGNGGGNGLYTYCVIAKKDGSYNYNFTFQCDNPELDSYDKLAQYLLSKGYYAHLRDGGDDYRPILSAVSYSTSSYSPVTGLLVSTPSPSIENGQPIIILNTLYLSSGTLYNSPTWLQSPDTFEIILVTE